MEQLKKALKNQVQQIKEGLEDEIKTGVFYDQEDLNEREYNLNDLRDLQHFAINDLSDIIEENQNAREKSDLAAMQ